MKIGDFGISKRVEASQKSPSTRMGTPGYMSPERMGITIPGLVEMSSDGYAADIWSLGEIAFQSMTNMLSFGNDINGMFEYVHGQRPFPVSLLEKKSISDLGQTFIKAAMMALPRDRMTAKKALSHSWVVNGKIREEESEILPDAR